jgi:hypothetical protein
MKHRFTSSLLLGIAIIFSAASLGAQVKADYDHSVTFSAYKTYSWLKVQGGDSLWNDRRTGRRCSARSERLD